MVQYTEWRSISDGSIISSIPDAAVSQFKIDEGSDLTLNNAFDEQPDATINGASWESVADLVGGWGLNFDGGDNVDIDNGFDFVDENANLSFCVTVDIDSIPTDESLWHNTDGSNYAIGVGFGQDGDNITVRFNDSGGNPRGDIGTTDIPSSGKIRVGVRLDVENFDGQFAINGDLKPKEDKSGRATINAAPNMLGAQDESSFNYNEILDNPIWYDSELTESEFQKDYNAQPWS